MVHNGYLQTAVNNGIPGLILYLAFLTGIFVLLIKTYRATTDRQKRFLLIAFIASITGYLVQDMFGWLDIALTPFFWIMLGLSVSLCVSDKQQVSLSQLTRKMLIILASLCSIFLIYLIVDATKKIYADNLFWKSQALSITNDWNQIEQNISKGLQIVPGEFYYKETAGLLYAKRLNHVADIDSYNKGISLFEQAYTDNPFDPGVLIHRIDIETVALLKGLIKTNPGVEIYATKLLAMDKNNPSVYEAIAKLRLAQQSYNRALETLQKAKGLGIKEERYYLLEGDINRAMKNTKAAIESYRNAIAVLEKKGLHAAQWKSAKYGVVFSLIDTGDFNEALNQINDVIAYDQSDVLSFIFKGDIYGHLKNYEQAEKSFQQALMIEPSNPYARRGYESAKKLLEK
jgi:predicted negative regulator of RcsB-dependent stress response